MLSAEERREKMRRIRKFASAIRRKSLAVAARRKGQKLASTVEDEEDHNDDRISEIETNTQQTSSSQANSSIQVDAASTDSGSERHAGFADRMSAIKGLLHKIGERKKEAASIDKMSSKTSMDGDECEVTISGKKKKMWRRHDNKNNPDAHSEYKGDVEGSVTSHFDSTTATSIEGKVNAYYGSPENDNRPSVAESLLSEDEGDDPDWMRTAPPTGFRSSQRKQQGPNDSDETISRQASRIRIVVEDYGSVEDDGFGEDTRSTATMQATNRGQRDANRVTTNISNDTRNHSTGSRTGSRANSRSGASEGGIPDDFDPVRARAQLALINKRIAQMEKEVVSTDERSVVQFTHDLPQLRSTSTENPKHYFNLTDNESIMTPPKSLRKPGCDGSAATEPSSSSEYSPHRKDKDPKQDPTYRASTFTSVSTLSTTPKRSLDSSVGNSASTGILPAEVVHPRKQGPRAKMKPASPDRHNDRLPFFGGVTAMGGADRSDLEKIVMEDMLSYVDEDDFDAFSQDDAFSSDSYTRDSFTQDIFVEDDVNTQDLMNFYDEEEESQGVSTADLRTTDTSFINWCSSCDM